MITLTSAGYFFPKYKLENSFFESLEIETTQDWISERTGIKSRYSVLSPEQIHDLRWGRININQLCSGTDYQSLSEIALNAWKTLKTEKKAYDFVLCGTSIPDFDIPAHASVIANEISQPKAACFDVNSACSSFVTNLMVAKGLSQTKSSFSALIFNPERYSTRLDFSDRKSCVLFGDGSSCVELSSQPDAEGFEVIDAQVYSDPSGHSYVNIPVNGQFWQNGAAVQKFAVTKTVQSSLAILERNNLSPERVNYFIGHQANYRMLLSACNKMKIDPKCHLSNVVDYGNQGAAGAPNVLGQNWSLFNTGDIVLITVVGSGLTWGSALLKYK